jgi:hypothetical protein
MAEMTLDIKGLVERQAVRPSSWVLTHVKRFWDECKDGWLNADELKNLLRLSDGSVSEFTTSGIAQGWLAQRSGDKENEYRVSEEQGRLLCIGAEESKERVWELYRNRHAEICHGTYEMVWETRDRDALTRSYAAHGVLSASKRARTFVAERALYQAGDAERFWTLARGYLQPERLVTRRPPPVAKAKAATAPPKSSSDAGRSASPPAVPPAEPPLGADFEMTITFKATNRLAQAALVRRLLGDA